MRADRLVSILLLLQVHQRMTVNELAKRLEVSRRTIYRDMEALSTAGIPITAERGAQGGWFLLEGYQTNLTGLSEAEISTLFLPRAASLLADLGLQKAADSALIKVLAALPAMQRHDAEDIFQRIYVDTVINTITSPKRAFMRQESKRAKLWNSPRDAQRDHRSR